MRSFLLLALLLPLVAMGQGPSWELVRSLPADTRIRVTEDGGKRFTGRISSTSETGLMFQPASAGRTFERQRIVTVAIPKPGHRLRNTFIGMGIGFAAGFTIGAIEDARCHDFLCGFGKPVLGGLGFLWGTGIGAAWPTGGWRPVYQR